MRMILESHDNYETITEKVFYRENLTQLEKEYTEKEFLDLDINTQKRVASDLKLNFKFVLTFGASITAFCPIVESFMSNNGISQIDIERDTVVYLTICALAIVFDNPKESYRKLFSELRLRNVYGMLKDLTKFIAFLKTTFNYMLTRVGKITYDIVGMFNYTLLFIPFALTMSAILKENKITLDTIISSITEDGGMKLTTIGLGITGITIRELIVTLFNKLKNFKFNNSLPDILTMLKSKIMSVVNKFTKKIDVKEVSTDLETKETAKNPGGVISWTQWKKDNAMPNETEIITED